MESRRGSVSFSKVRGSMQQELFTPSLPPVISVGCIVSSWVDTAICTLLLLPLHQSCGSTVAGAKYCTMIASPVIGYKEKCISQEL